MERRDALALFAMMSDEDLLVVVDVVQQAVMLGDGWIQRDEHGFLRSRSSGNVVISERRA